MNRLFNLFKSLTLFSLSLQREACLPAGSDDSEEDKHRVNKKMETVNVILLLQR
jgi:hypothetical protein